MLPPDTVTPKSPKEVFVASRWRISSRATASSCSHLQVCARSFRDFTECRPGSKLGQAHSTSAIFNAKERTFSPTMDKVNGYMVLGPGLSVNRPKRSQRIVQELRKRLVETKVGQRVLSGVEPGTEQHSDES